MLNLGELLSYLVGFHLVRQGHNNVHREKRKFIIIKFIIIKFRGGVDLGKGEVGEGLGGLEGAETAVRM